MFEKLKFWIIIIIALLAIGLLLPYQNITSYIRYAFYTKSDLRINLTLINPEVKSLSADSSNKLVMRVEVRNSSGMPVPQAHIVMSTNSNLGHIYPERAWTGIDGDCLITYTPPSYTSDKFLNGNPNIKITAALYKSNPSSSVNIELKRPPVILMLGYLADVQDLDNLTAYLSAKGFEAAKFKYDSTKGLISSSDTLNKFLSGQKSLYLAKGFQVKGFDIIAHSFGGLVTRYYTCSEDYIKNSDVRKLIFLSVPQRGSPWASLAANYFNDQGIKDLIPENTLLTKNLPGMINKGLNNTIQVGSIMDQYDEVVSPESASLEEWGIKTEVFNVGGNNFSMNNIFDGSKIMESSNHKKVLSNKKVYEKILEMLNADLPYPVVRK